MTSTVNLSALLANAPQSQGSDSGYPQMTQEQIEEAFRRRQLQNRMQLGLPTGGYEGQNPALGPQMPQVPDMQQMQGAALGVPQVQHPLLRTQPQQNQVDLRALIQMMRGQ